MAQGAQFPAAEDAFVLLITDHADLRRPLARGIDLVMPCRTAAAWPLGGGRPALVVLDLAPPIADAILAETPWIPTLVLRRGGPQRTSSSPIVRSLPATAARETILAGVFAMIEVGANRTRRLEARSAAATGIVTEIFDSAALGAGFQQAEIDRGTDLVLAAVSEAGIGDWLATVWRHDAGVYQHTLGVAGYAAAFGALVGLSRADQHRLTKAALLHDIGKARIPVEILNKPGRLTPEEMRLMRRHPEIGAGLLVAQGGFEPEIVEVVRHHHEKMDGTGYPAGLQDGAITDLVRIVAICDVFSALTERRTYRDPIAAPEALATMDRMKGHLDGALMRAFAPVALGRAMAAA
ncbi:MULTISPECIES: HD domain-containing phosphohydrolase [unclassified Methylobacterium]|uniref:HD-GYP domain-containing protein n=1 Tax=unclassified Methylobacterium TaxID=2615210 RepID=UPI001FEF2F8E|nr:MULTISPECIES: HD domain-containing phosphohydrolase [unclassified Methylobacterium]